MIKLISLITIIFLFGCTDANRLSYQTLGHEFDIKCYSGGKLIYEGKTTGQHSSSEGGNFVFKDLNNKGIEINANCIFSTDLK